MMHITLRPAHSSASADYYHINGTTEQYAAYPVVPGSEGVKSTLCMSKLGCMSKLDEHT